MSQPIDREGIFRAIVATVPEIKKSEKGSVGILMAFDITEMLVNKEWVDWSPYQMTVDGTFWIIKKDGSVNETATQDLKSIGWDGRGASLAALHGKSCQTTVKSEVYKDKTRYRAEFLKPYDYEPGGEAIVANDFDNQYGSQLRAIFGSPQAPKPSGRPATPPPPPARSAPPAAAPGGGTATLTGSAVVNKDTAWAATMEAWAGKDNALRNASWEKALTSVCAKLKKPEAALTPADWVDVATAADINDENIPF